jgi:hypothetical protein
VNDYMDQQPSPQKFVVLNEDGSVPLSNDDLPFGVRAMSNPTSHMHYWKSTSVAFYDDGKVVDREVVYSQLFECDCGARRRLTEWPVLECKRL